MSKTKTYLESIEWDSEAPYLDVEYGLDEPTDAEIEEAELLNQYLLKCTNYGW